MSEQFAAGADFTTAGCVSGKTIHATAEGARGQIRSLKAAQDRSGRGQRRRIRSTEGARQHERNGRELVPYRCSLCDHWHVGHS